MSKKVVIATHVFSPGTSQALREYLEGKHKLLFIEHPLSGNIFTWTWGALHTFWRVIRTGNKYDLYIGSNNLNSFIGVLLKRVGRVRKVIFYTPDSPPHRFRNRLLNHIYYWMDYFCVRNCELVWNNSPEMIIQREKRGTPVSYRTKQLDVPMGTDRIEQLSFSQINRYQIGFVGHLKEGMGLEILIDAFRIISAEIPESSLLIIGSGPIEERLKNQAEDLNIEFTGLINRLPLVYEKLSLCALAAAPYEENTSSQFTDPGKVKLYLSCALPVIITRVPRIADEIEDTQAGVVIAPNAEELAEAALGLLKNELLLTKFRQNALALAGRYSWESIFERALEGFI